MNNKKAKKTISFFCKAEDRRYTINDEHKYRIRGSVLHLPTPNNTGIFLNLSDKEIDRASKLWADLFDSVLLSKTEKRFTDNEITSYYDYITHIQTAVICLFTSFESFVNSLIPFDFLCVENCNGGTIMMDKSYVERNKSIEFKLSVVLPDALQIAPPKESKNWAAFKKLIQLRNNIIHMKMDALDTVDPEKDLYYNLISPSIFKTLSSAKALLSEIMDQVVDSWEVPIIEENDSVLQLVFEDLDTAVDYFQYKGILSKDDDTGTSNSILNNGEVTNKDKRIYRSSTITRIK